VIAALIGTIGSQRYQNYLEEQTDLIISAVPVLEDPKDPVYDMKGHFAEAPYIDTNLLNKGSAPAVLTRIDFEIIDAHLNTTPNLFVSLFF
jgi:hypothetical protein